MNAGLFGLAMNRMESHPIEFAEQFSPDFFSFFDLFILCQHFQMIWDGPEQIDGLVFFIFVLVQSAQGINDKNDILAGFDSE